MEISLREKMLHSVKETFSNNVSNLVDKFDNLIKRYRSHSKQLSLHTGIFYIGKNEKQTFARVSESLAHNPGAIWAHLRPILLNIRQSSDVEKIYIFSDGPTTQYRQICNFFMFSTELHKLGFSYAEWNFFESGHGKGIPDAVGGSLKRKADSKVKFWCDITSAKTFVDSVAGGGD